MTIIGYAYDADTHCVPCTKLRFPTPGDEPDEHSIPMYAEDTERNPITPIFSWTEILQDVYCGQCRGIIAEAYKPDDPDEDGEPTDETPVHPP